MPIDVELPLSPPDADAFRRQFRCGCGELIPQLYVAALERAVWVAQQRAGVEAGDAPPIYCLSCRAWVGHAWAPLSARELAARLERAWWDRPGRYYVVRALARRLRLWLEQQMDRLHERAH